MRPSSPNLPPRWGFYPILDLDRWFPPASAGSAPASAGPLELAAGLAALGVPLIQLRAKRLGAGAFLAIARQTVAAAPSAAIVINDRADVARLSGAAGVHLGQTDLPAAAVRPLLGPGPLAATWRRPERQRPSVASPPSPAAAKPGSPRREPGSPTRSSARWGGSSAPWGGANGSVQNRAAEPLLGFSTHSAAQARAALAGPGAPFSYLALGPVFATNSKSNPDPVVGVEEIVRVRAFYSGPLVAIGGITLARCPAVWAAGADAVAVIGGWLDDPQPLARARQYMLEFEEFSRQSGGS